MKYLLLIGFLFFLTGCTKPDETKNVLEMDGYSDITITDYCGWNCGKGDTFATGFVATKNKRLVIGCVCSGAWLKGQTIRINSVK